MSYLELYNAWLNHPQIDEATKVELESIKDNESEIKERFFKDLEFGTAGLRGIIGAGTNRMNFYTVTRATQGLANYILKQNGADKGVAIAFDSRRMSKEFAFAAAKCLVANGIKVYVFEDLRPTPELSFSIRHLGCISGINITASHNPPEYNGYKVYWEDGAQITPPHDKKIMDEVQSLSPIGEAKTLSDEETLESPLYKVIGKEVDDAYNEVLKKQLLHPELAKEYGSKLKVVYTPLHGAGNIAVRRILSEIGFANVYVVKEQELPNGEFPTVSYPNPEVPEAFELGLKLAKEVDADIIFATDPDSDRLGVQVKDKAGEYHLLTGNMTGCIIAEYLLSQRKAKNNIPEDGKLIKTIVTTNLMNAIAKAYGVDLVETFTGFKNIGKEMRTFEEENNGSYIFGFEESYGYLAGTHARDKDAIVAAMVLAEALAYYYSQGMTLWDQILKMYDQYGYFKDVSISFELKGIEGLNKIKSILAHLRENVPTTIGNYKVLAFRDYQIGERLDLVTNEKAKMALSGSNVLYYELENDFWVCIRPSGTEPKLKLYACVKGETNDLGLQIQKELDNTLRTWIQSI